MLLSQGFFCRYLFPGLLGINVAGIPVSQSPFGFLAFCVLYGVFRWISVVAVPSFEMVAVIMFKYSLSVFLFFVLTVSSALSHAEFLSGDDLIEYFDALNRTNTEKPRDGDWQKVGMLQGFMMGVADAERGAAFCAPQGTSLGQLVGITGEYLAGNPGLWDRPAKDITLKALSSRFPCKK